MQKVADLFDRDRTGRTPLVPGQLGDRGDVGLDGPGGLAVQLEFADHLLTQGSHVSSCLGKWAETEIQCKPPVSSLPLLLAPPCARKKPGHPRPGHDLFPAPSAPERLSSTVLLYGYIVI